MYSREQIEQVRSTIDIVDTVRSFVPSLKASGRSVKGLCPFHGERTPSFHVHPEKGLFKCFGCGESGDVIAFISKMEQATFSEALERLAAQAGIVLKKQNSPQKKQEDSLREKIFQVLDGAKNFYQKQLWETKQGKTALSYLEKRGISEETIEKFQLGFAPNSGESAFETLIKKGFSIDLCQKAGLVSRSQTGRYFDPMFGRIIFPIEDNFGHIIGFGGRILEQKAKSILEQEEKEGTNEGPKYLNSPETPVFSKGRSLYGLFQAKQAIMKKRQVLVLEGYMDVIAVHQAGIDSAVATLGTAFTRDHAKLIKRYADEAVAFFDPDEAGQKAAVRSLEPMVLENIYPRVVIPDGDDDPDELIQRKGRDEVQNIIDRAPDFVDYLLETGLATRANNLQEKTKLAQMALGIIAKSPNGLLKSEWAMKVSKALGFQLDVLKNELKKVGGSRESQPTPVARPKARRTRVALPSAEEEYLSLILNWEGAWKDLVLDENDFSEERGRRLFLLIKEQILKQSQVSAPALNDAFQGEEKEWFMNLMMEEREFSDPLELKDRLIRDIRKKRDTQRLAALSKQVAMGQANQQERGEYLELLRRVKGSTHTLVSK